MAHRRLFASDLDGTLVPDRSVRPRTDNAKNLRRFKTWLETQLDMRVVYVTGRYFDYAREGIRREGLPVPHAIICNVGAEIWNLDGGEFILDHGWEERNLETAGKDFAPRVRTVMKQFSFLKEQEPEKNSNLKISYYFGPSVPEAEARVQAENMLVRLGLMTHVIVSRDPNNGTGLLDILPVDVSKKNALWYLLKKWGIPPASCVFSGDTMNDYDLLISGVNAIVVANAKREVKALVRTRGGQNSYIACGNYGEEGAFVSGVLEGLKHYRWLEE